jgi:hypothetical protein
MQSQLNIQGTFETNTIAENESLNHASILHLRVG